MTTRPPPTATGASRRRSPSGSGARADWDVPAPVDGWTARDVVGHLTTWFPAFLDGGRRDAAARAGRRDDPVGAWEAHAAVQALLDDPESAGQKIDNPHIGDDDGRRRDGQDLHGRRLHAHLGPRPAPPARTTVSTPRFCAALLEGMEQMEDAVRASGQYGPRVPVADDADAQTRMLGFIGRDPAWRPAAAGVRRT